MSPKIIILVIASLRKPFWMLERRGPRATWAKVPNAGATVLYVYGNGIGRTRILGDRLFAPCPEGFENIGKKTLAAFRRLIATRDFTHVFRTNISSYIYVPGLISLARTLGDKGVYSGTIGHFEDSSFASGSGYLLSRDVVSLVVDHADDWEHEYIDDVALGRLLGRLGIPPRDYKRMDVLDQTAIDSLREDDLRSYFHFRCKSADGDRLHDVRAMKRIHEMYEDGMDGGQGVQRPRHTRE